MSDYEGVTGLQGVEASRAHLPRPVAGPTPWLSRAHNGQSRSNRTRDNDHGMIHLGILPKLTTACTPPRAGADRGANGCGLSRL